MLSRTEKIIARIEELATISDQPNGITRTYGSPAFIAANELLLSWFNKAGLITRIDNIGNVRGVLKSNSPQAKTFIIASHADTVVNAGKFDGPLGVIMGIDLLENLAKQKVDLPFHLELICFCDEEGVRFHTTYLGSKVIAGSFDNVLLLKKDANNITLEEAIKGMGGNPAALDNDAISRNNFLGYFEIHIEQGPVLYEANIPLGIVTSIAGQKRAVINFTGIAGHAGTVPMAMRADALCCAAECIIAIEAYAIKHTGVLATAGTLQVSNQATNVIPGKVSCSLDVRSADEDVLETAWQAISSLITQICLRRKIEGEIQLVQSSLPVKCDYHLNFLLSRAITKAGYPVEQLMSGAGHDAVPLSAIGPVAMLFVKCYEGISHNPQENVAAEDVEAAWQLADLFLENLIQYYNQQ